MHGERLRCSALLAIGPSSCQPSTQPSSSEQILLHTIFPFELHYYILVMYSRVMRIEGMGKDCALESRHYYALRYYYVLACTYRYALVLAYYTVHSSLYRVHCIVHYLQ